MYEMETLGKYSQVLFQNNDDGEWLFGIHGCRSPLTEKAGWFLLNELN